MRSRYSLKPPWIVGGLAQHVGQVDIVERQHLADDIEDAVGQHRAHLVELFQQALEDAAFDDGLAVLGLGGDEVEGVDIALLADAVDAAEPLFQAGRDSTAGRS